MQRIDHRRRRTIAALSGIALLAACASRPAMTVISGTVTYRQRLALPPDAEIRVVLEDQSRADAPAQMIGETWFVAGGNQVPFRFEIPYDRDKVDPTRTYGLRATITYGGRLRFTTDRATPVLTRGAPDNFVELVVVAAA